MVLRLRQFSLGRPVPIGSEARGRRGSYVRTRFRYFPQMQILVDFKNRCNLPPGDLTSLGFFTVRSENIVATSAQYSDLFLSFFCLSHRVSSEKATSRGHLTNARRLRRSWLPLFAIAANEMRRRVAEVRRSTQLCR